MAQRVNVKAHPSQLQLGKVDSHVLLELFPFALILDHDMCITNAGEKIIETWILQNPKKPPQLFLGSHITDIFKLRRPKGISFNWQTVIHMNLVIFELELIRGVDSDNEDGDGKENATELSITHHARSLEESESDPQDYSSAIEAAQVGIGRPRRCPMNNPKSETLSLSAMERRGSQGWTRVLLKGQMRYIADIDSIVFLCSPL